MSNRSILGETETKSNFTSWINKVILILNEYIRGSNRKEKKKRQNIKQQ